MKEHCQFCDKQIHYNFSIYKIVLQTDNNLYELGLLTLLESLGEWRTNRGYHISASQIVLLRPDILREFFEDYYEERVAEWNFIQNIICRSCYAKYKNYVPVK